jgi:metal-responsive CopG/Arc/MetJ family transcriptional regulator
MKAGTSLTLSEDLVASIGRLAGPKVSRSAYVEQILREFVNRRAQARKDIRDERCALLSVGLLPGINTGDSYGAQATTA